MDYTTFLDKTTSFPKRNGLIRNTSAISHTVVAEKNLHDFSEWAQRKTEEGKIARLLCQPWIIF